MSMIFAEGFDHYGYDEDNMLDGAWADIGVGVGGVAQLYTPPFGARTGPRCMRFVKGTSTDNPEHIRRVLGAAHDELIIGMALYMPVLPLASTLFVPMQLRDVDNNILFTITVRSDGGVQLRNGNHVAAVLAQTTGPVLVAGSWEHIEFRIVRHASTGIFTLRVNETEVLDATGLALGSTNISQIVMGISNGNAGVGYEIYYDDLVVKDEAGSYNNTFTGDLRVAALQPLSNAVAQGWTPRSIEKLDVGVLACLDDDRDQTVYYSDNDAFELADGDYCIEMFVRFNYRLTGAQTATLISKYRSSTDERSFRLYHKGPDDGDLLTLAVSEDGTTVNEVHAFPFVPDINRWYHIEIDRSGTDSYLFIDGVQKGVTQVDNFNYDVNTSKLFVNGRQNGSTTAFTSASVKGWMDGVRLTKGAARHTANFSPPTAALPANNVDDPLYDNVELLLNFDEATIVDQSNNAFSGTILGSASVVFPDDDEAYQTIWGLTPEDNDFIEAALVAAQGTLTFVDNPSNSEVVVLGSTTYTFVTALSVADDVLIGTDAAESLANLIAAVNAEAGEGTLYGTGTVQNTEASLTQLPGLQALAEARTPGATGNSVVSTTDVTNATWTAGTLAGGADIPGESEFNLSALPPEVTGIRAVCLVGRNFKTDSGSSELTMSFVTSGGSEAAGAARPMTLSPTYYQDVIEEDPATMGALTPSSLQGARIKVDRTT